MKTLHLWIEEEQEKTPREIAQDTYIYSRSYGDGLHDGWLKAMKHVLGELKAREDQGQESQDSKEERNADVGEDMARERHARAKRRRGPRGGYPRETWGDDDD